MEPQRGQERRAGLLWNQGRTVVVLCPARRTAALKGVLRRLALANIVSKSRAQSLEMSAGP